MQESCAFAVRHAILGFAMAEPLSTAASDDPILARLEDQIGWYDRKSQAAQRTFKRIKVIEILAAALIPFLTSFKFLYGNLVIGGLGVLITILEGLLHLNQYQQNWTTYRSTCEQLKHEKFVYLALAGPYANTPNPRALLADRVESTVSQEHAQWATAQQSSGKGQGG
jgi:hypothetical protein